MNIRLSQQHVVDLARQTYAAYAPRLRGHRTVYMGCGAPTPDHQCEAAATLTKGRPRKRPLFPTVREGHVVLVDIYGELVWDMSVRPDEQPQFANPIETADD